MSQIRNIIVLMLGICFILVNVPNMNVESVTTKAFGNPPGNLEERTIEFSGTSSPYFDATNYITVPTNKGKITNATMKIKGLDDGKGNFPRNLLLDVGMDDDQEWAFDGDGYGSLGLQDRFENDNAQTYIYVPQNTNNDDMSVLLPKNAKMIDSKLELNGTLGVKILNGRNPPVGTVTGQTLAGTYSYFDASILYLEVDFYSSDFDTYDIDIDGFDPQTQGWNSIYDYHGYSYPGVFQRSWNPPVYSKWRITYYDYENNDRINYSYEYRIGGTAQNVALNIGDDSQPYEWSQTGDLDGIEVIPDFTDALNQSLLNLPIAFEDDYGNQFVEVPLIFTAGVQGGFMLEKLAITYDYTATVDIKPINSNLVNELNDLIPEQGGGEDIFNIYLGLSSDSPGKVKISDINIEYNGAPECLGIPKLMVDEDIDTKAMNLTEISNDKELYFKDDFDSPAEMSYGIYSNSDPTHVELSITDDLWLRVNPVVPNWYGSIKAQLWCKDTEGIMTISNEFPIEIVAVNDPPMVNYPIPNINLRENQIYTPIDLDDPKMEYFIDIDSEILYYRAALEYPEIYGDDLKVEVLPETNELRFSSIGTYGKSIKVFVYCDDNPELLDLSISELKLIETYQTIFVNITSITASFPPQWLEIPLDPIPEDEPQLRVLNLKDYVIDEDDAISNLSFSIQSLTHSGYIDIVIENNLDLSIYPHENFDETAYMTLAVTDDEQNRDLVVVPIEIIPFNDLPTVYIAEPQDGDEVGGIVDIIGSAYDPENELAKVEISIGISGTWTPVNGLGYWTYALDVTELPSSQTEIIVKARAEDNVGSQSLVDKITLKVQQRMVDSDEDGVEDKKDKFPNNPTEWKDSDNDGYGDNIDLFPQDDTQWVDTDGDEYGDNINGNRADQFPTDPTQWNDTDRDGHGDNPWGNDADYYPHDPEQWERQVVEKKEEKKESRIINTYQLSYMLLGIVIVITLLIFVNYIFLFTKNRKTKPKIEPKKEDTK